MSLEKLNGKLASFFTSLAVKNIEKTASLGNFSDVKNSDEVARVAAMTKEILELPKYQPIISRLKSASGIVNFVTHDEYQPLVELLLKKVFPASNNDLFTLPAVGGMPQSGSSPQQKMPASYYNQVDLDQEWFVAPEFFSSQGDIVQGDPKAILKARKRLENLLMGTKVKITRKWLKEEAGMSESEMEDLLGREPTPQEIQRQVDQQAANPNAPVRPIGSLTPLGTQVLAYERALDEINQRYDKHINQLDSEIFEHNMGDTVFPNPEDFQKKKRQRNIWVTKKRESVEALNDSIGNSIDASRVLGTVDRNNDGFVNYSPQNNIKTLAAILGRKVLTYLKESRVRRESKSPRTPEQEKEIKRQEQEVERDILVTSLNLKKQLQDAYTSNPSLQAINEQWIEFLGDGTHNDFLRMVNSIMGIYTQLRTSYQRVHSRQGKVLVIDDFDKSSLCHRTADGKISLEDVTKSVFVDFMGKNAGNLERDESLSATDKIEMADERGNRIVLVISSERISNLPSNAIVELNVSPVDKAEAEIIVRNILKQYVFEAQKNIKRKMYREIGDKYGDLSSKEAKEEANKIKTYLDDQSDLLGNISEETRIKMMTQIIGLGQKEAINAVRMAIASGIDLSGEDIVREEFNFNEARILTNLEEDVGERFSEGIKGVFKMKREIEFEDYAYDQASDWAKHVGTVKRNVDYFRFLRTTYESNKRRIRDIIKLLRVSASLPLGHKQKMSDEMVKSLMEEKNGLELESRDNQAKIELEASDQLPHFFILYGDPGVGKTVFGSALASLLNYSLYNLDISDQKNMWYGSTEENCHKLLNYLKTVQEAVFVVDEVDRQLSQGDVTSTHAVDKAIQAKLLEFFGNRANDEIFTKNKIYFIMTTNNIDQVDTALKARADVRENVPRPKSKEAYSAILRSSIKNLKPRYPKAPIDSINWDFVAKALSSKEVDFRHVEQMMETSLRMDATWQQTIEMFASGMTDSLGDLQGLGMPLTIENMLETCDIIASGQTHGVIEVIGERTKKVRAMLEPYLKGEKKFDTVSVVNPYTKKAQDRLKFPDELTTVMRGEGASKEVPSAQTSPEGWEYKKTIDPETGRATVDLKPKVNPAEEMRQLQDTGFEEKPLVEMEQEKQRGTEEESASKKKKEDVAKKPGQQLGQQQEQKEKVASSTDYFFDYLQKEGLIHDNKIVVPQKSVNEKPIVMAKENPKKIEEGSIDDLASKGVFYFGGLLVAPKSDKVKPQQLRSFQREL